MVASIATECLLCTARCYSEKDVGLIAFIFFIVSRNDIERFIADCGRTQSCTTLKEISNVCLLLSCISIISTI